MKTLTVLLLLVTVTTCHPPFKVIFRWYSVDVMWPSDEVRQYAINHGDYIPANNYLACVKFWKTRMYLTVPRWKEGVPVTLGTTFAVAVNRQTAPKLEAFPSWDMQKIDDCRAFQFVQNVEIDPMGRMWVLDSGRTATMTTEKKTGCPPRLVILELEKNETLLIHEFPPHVARRGTAYLNDIVLDHEDGGLAYITDSDKDDPGIIVYSLANNTSWKVRHDSMKVEAEAAKFMVHKTPVNVPIPVNGIALSPASNNDRQLYYSPLSSFHLYSIPTSALKSNVSNIDSFVKELGRKSSQSDGMTMSATGVLYFGLLADDAVSMWDTKQSASFSTGMRVISRDHERLQWPDTFAFDEDGNLHCITNSLQNFLVSRVNITASNFRILQSKPGVKNYQYLEDGTAPEQPEIPASTANRINLGVAMGLAVLLAIVAQ
ncbi:dopaminechrome tautomerase [Ptiloglossa arizonensis]|uniref:dopaminechrome tautomerase n=1 Tax=Ptiloglossa arizonensis TaxID=3350558 RepID=UPI003FA11889